MTGTAEGLRELLEPRGYKHLSWYDIQETAARGCPLCRVVWDVTENADWDHDEDGRVVLDEIRVTGTFSEPDDAKGGGGVGHPLEGLLLEDIAFHIPMRTPPYGEGEVFYLAAFDGDPAARIVPGRRESKDLTSEAASRIRRWLDECQDEHSSCPNRRDYPLPRRVIDLESSLRLHQSSPDEKGPYATLSYCWGGIAQLTTTKANLRDFVQSIDPTGLSKTITDAVEVCRAVGLRYLWVDALCIVQDDENDKLDQIAKMQSIYKNSTLTIVAASAEKTTDGFVGSAKLNEPWSQLPLHVDHATAGTVYLRMEGDETDTWRDPIFQRGWTYQEQLLSPRVVMFDSAQITVKCSTDHYRPVFDTFLEVNLAPSALPAGVFGVERNRGYFVEDEARDRTWRNIVHDYSQRDLTSFADRLPALAGIAAELAAVWDDVYLAGMWKRTIIQHLGWHRTQRRTMQNQGGYHGYETENRKNLFDGVVDHTRRTAGPTWSWVTAPYPVYIYEMKHPDAHLVGSHVQLVSPKSPFGQVASASITIDAKVLDAAAALGPDVEFLTGPVDGFHGVQLDFEDPSPDIDRCKLVYLGRDNRHDGQFLVVERTEAAQYQRVGFIRPPRYQDLLGVAKREILVLV
ncbi:heterokaryon incompatibility protein-domain-containing protein [Chaetomium sp. MPI-CAGE-AT-0009]|nr:heterokaryon incompatibility protein-domain-containing protein [Chaetomium sp. MPI-CAGE-AT-0009]